MLFTVTIIILAATLTLMFSSEAIKFFKWLFKIPGVALILPIFLVTYLIMYDKSLTNWLIQNIKLWLNATLNLLTAILPFKSITNFVAKLILLMTISFVPVWLVNIWHIKKNYISIKHPYFLTGVLWLIVVMLLSTVP